eukprot:TRINITY_DN2909_c0_g1_i1.p1 TRINITY_DN2909_c0_g1~~TRINITY_DN2909_c0_g1_i1.p1  ORF type:complete len:239 (+),score=59.04 TRINITY_DN2909_c0_g1_i1:149-865(+)
MEQQPLLKKRNNIILINNAAKSAERECKPTEMAKASVSESNQWKPSPPHTVGFHSAPQPQRVVPDYNRHINYYQEFWRLYLQNELLISQMRECTVQNREMQAKIGKFEELIKLIEGNMVNVKVKKKNRRTAAQIEKTFNCPYDKCSKTYGSDVSLNLHIKLKHNGGNKTEREKQARKIIIARMKGEELPNIPAFNFPPGYLEKIQEKMLKRKTMQEYIQQEGDEASDLEGCSSDGEDE